MSFGSVVRDIIGDRWYPWYSFPTRIQKLLLTAARVGGLNQHGFTFLVWAWIHGMGPQLAYDLLMFAYITREPDGSKAQKRKQWLDYHLPLHATPYGSQRDYGYMQVQMENGTVYRTLIPPPLGHPSYNKM